MVVGGVESMTRAPLVMAKAREAFARGDVTVYDSTLGWRFVNPRMEALYGTHPLGETAELVAELHHVSREEQDAFALESQRRWAAAHAAGKFADELVRRRAPGGRGGAARRFEVDEHPRPATTAAELAALKPAFRKSAARSPPATRRGSTTARRRCCWRRRPGSRGSAARRAPAWWRPPSRASSRSTWASARSRPPRSSVARRAAARPAGPRRAERSVRRAGHPVHARAAPRPRPRERQRRRDRASGTRWARRARGWRPALAHELGRRGARFGLASMCIGVGQGIAVILERV